jgi:glyoxylase-like metal-dependent hydrolase (beta-lactamase superfamily II)
MTSGQAIDSPAPGPPVQVADDIWRIVLPTPFPVGSVNAYLIDDDPLTLLDTGQRDGAARTALQSGMADVGYRIEDLERIIVSHQHIDHWGLAAELARRSGAEVCALSGFAGWLSRVPEAIRAEQAYMRDTVTGHGGTAAAAAVIQSDHSYGETLTVDRRLQDGDALEFARRTLTVLHRPGHSASDTAFLDVIRGVLLGADLLMHRPSTAVLAPRLDGAPATRRPRALARQLASLRTLEALELSLVLPGHGPVVEDHDRVLARQLERWERMIENTRRALAEGPLNGIDVARRVRGDLTDRAPFFALCDVLGCLDVLIEGGHAQETVTGTQVAFHLPAG